MLQHQDMTIWSTNDIESNTLSTLSAADQNVVREIVRWSKDFLLNTHSELGRDGPVCPFTKPSMTHQLYYVASPQHGADLSRIQGNVLRYKQWYDELILQQEDANRNFLTFLIPLPDFDRSDASQLDELQGRLKNDFVKQGLMIGQFHPKCDQAGLWNQQFRPLRCTEPLLAIRVMVLFDMPFLIDNEAHLDAYLANFASNIPRKMRGQLLSRLYAPRA